MSDSKEGLGCLCEKGAETVQSCGCRRYPLVSPVTPQESILEHLLQLYDTPYRLSVPYHNDLQKGVHRPAHLPSLLQPRSATTTNPHPYMSGQ